MEEYMSTKKSKKEEINMENQNVNEDLFGLKDEDYERLIIKWVPLIPLMEVVTGVGGVSRMVQPSLQRPSKKSIMDHFFHSQSRDGCSKSRVWKGEPNNYQRCLLERSKRKSFYVSHKVDV